MTAEHSWPSVVNEISECNFSNRSKMTWVTMTGFDFKMACISIQTPIAKKTARFYLELEETFIAYTKYTEQFRQREKESKAESSEHEWELRLQSARSDYEILCEEKRQISEQELQSTRSEERQISQQALQSARQMSQRALQLARSDNNILRRENNIALRTLNKEIARRDYRHDLIVTRLPDEKSVMMSTLTTSRERLRVHINELASRHVPICSIPTREEQLVVVKMSPKYVYVLGEDPAYLENCTYVFVRTQRRRVKKRLNTLKRLGRGTNDCASIHHIIGTPNSRLLFIAFKHLARNGKVIMLKEFGGILKSNDNAMMELLSLAEMRIKTK